MRYLEIKNFGPVKDAYIEIKSLNLFIGEQSIGKSTVAKLISLFTNKVVLFMVIKDEKAWKEALTLYDLDIYDGSPYSITFFTEEFGKGLKVFFSNQSCDVEYSVENDKISDRQEVVSILMRQGMPDMSSFNIGDDIQKTMKEAVGEILKQSLYVPAERNLAAIIANALPAMTIAKASVPNSILFFLSDYYNARAEYKRMDMSMLGIEYLNSDSTDEFVVKSTGSKYPMQAASSGIQSAAPLLLVLKYAGEHGNYSSFVIEEPECNLYPDKQVELLYFIIKTLREKGPIITITTHSPYLLSSINNLLYAGSLSLQADKTVKENIREIYQETLWYTPKDCAVYSLGEEANAGEAYCRNIIDEETGLVDFNALDKVSIAMGDDFNRLEQINIDIIG